MSRPVMARGDHPFARVVPYRWRRVHRWFAWQGGYFWLPCPLCAAPFGGHEVIDGNAGSIPKPGYEPPSPYGPWRRSMICPACVTRRRDDIEATATEVVFDTEPAGDIPTDGARIVLPHPGWYRVGSPRAGEDPRARD